MDENNMANNQQNNDIRFDVEETVNVVSAETDGGKKKIIPVIIAVAVVIVAVAAVLVWYFVGSKSPADTGNEGLTAESHAEMMTNGDQLLEYINDNMDADLVDEEGNSISKEEYISKLQSVVSEATTTVKENVGNVNPNKIEVPTTSAVDNGNQENNGNGADNGNNNVQVDAAQNKKAQEAIKMFFNRSCYMKGAMYGGNEGNSLVMSMDGNNFEVLTNLDGTEVSILCLDDTLYIKRPATKQYIELTDTVMDLIGISAADFNMGFGTADFDKMQDKFVSAYNVRFNGEDAVCHEYKSDEQIFRFYTVGDTLKEIDISDIDGTYSTQLVIDYFSAAIPGDQLTLKGYTASSITVLFADLM